jgi:hypothetical protein
MDGPAYVTPPFSLKFSVAEFGARTSYCYSESFFAGSAAEGSFIKPASTFTELAGKSPEIATWISRER